MAYKNEAVVYVITNSINARQYVGSTTNFSHRRQCHLYDLKNKNGREGSLFQSDYDFQGCDVFEFSILMKFPKPVSKDELIKYEQLFIDRLNPAYNVNKIAGKYFGEQSRTEEAKEKHRQAMLGRIQSQEEKEKRSNSRREYYRTHEVHLSDEKKQHLSEINMGENNPNFGLKRSDETRNSISKSNSKVQYTFINPEGYECVFTNLSKWCEIENKNYWAMRKLYQGKRKEWEGWTFVSATKLP